MTRKRSNAPIFWALFGAGGALAALVGPILVLITGILTPAGLWIPQSALSYDRVLAFSQNWVGKAALFVVVSLFFWHAAHRIFHSLHDVGIHAGTAAKLLCYGLALLGTVVAAAALLSVGF
jgi:succinate dehydrogenase subunit D